VTNPDLITSVDDLKKRYRAPSSNSLKKEQSSLSDAMQLWLAASPFFIMSTAQERGIDCSPRGDNPGEAFRVIDSKHIAIPDRRGNNRLDTMQNLLEEPRIGLLFLVPGCEEALRIKGHASISINQQLLESFSLDDELPAAIILITIERVHVQNARAIRQASLWSEDAKKRHGPLPDATSLMKSEP